ncbi:hemolysin-type calcium-binding region [Gloeothece verrucosa]|uniref:Hemolysin-type calcium-binding region n=1 Tax=Gloeothece verrucosa (strain PCC 7822) TaxID=497965 RepID=E0UKQ4_GLOV7|nr:hemolysin-type calcium-binding region [Gloeothece verrucosa]ADN17534.1 Hemolysin-type calcium-binding region [Gloeothece verrucosa PCC 7822]
MDSFSIDIQNFNQIISEPVDIINPVSSILTNNLILPGFIQLTTPQIEGISQITSINPSNTIISQSTYVNSNDKNNLLPNGNDSLLGINNNVNTFNRSITELEQTTILDGLNSFTEWVDNLEKVQKINDLLSPNPSLSILTLEKSINKTFDFSNAFQNGLVNPIKNYFLGVSPTVEGLLSLFKTLSTKIGDINITVDPTLVSGEETENNLEFHLKWIVDATQTSQFKLQSNSEKIRLNTNENTLLDLMGQFALDFSFGVENNLSNPTFYLNFNDLSITGAAKTDTLNTSLNLGFLQANVKNLHLDLSGEANVNFIDPNNNNKITLSELQSTPISQLINITPSGSLNVELPIELGASKSISSITIKDDNLLDETQANVVYSSPQIENFVNFDINKVQNILGTVEQGAEKLISQINLENNIPYLKQNFENIISFSENISKLKRSIIENSVTGTADISNGKITEDAVFYLAINNDIQHPVGIKVFKDDSNQTIDDLVDDINTAFEQARLKNVVEAFSREGKIGIRTFDLNDQFTLINSKPTTVNELGLQDQLFSEQKLFPFATLWNLYDIDVSQNGILVNFNLSHTLKNNISFDFTQAIDTNIGQLNLTSDSQGEIEATANLNLIMKIDLNAVGDNFDLNENTPLSSLNDGRGIAIDPQNSNTLNDITISLRDGTVAEVDLNKAETVGDIIKLIETNSLLLNKIDVEIVNDSTEINLNKSLKFKDLTSGNNQFSIIAVPGHLAGFSLGILGTDSLPVITGENIGSDLSPETLLSNLNNKTGVRVIESLPDIQINLKDGSHFTVDFNLNPNSTLNDIIDAINKTTDNKVIAKFVSKLNPTTNQYMGMIQLEDKSSGNKLFSITEINNSLKGKDLGIIGSTSSNIFTGTPLSNYAETTPVALTYETYLSTLNRGRGVRSLENKDDLQFNLKNGDQISLKLVINDQTKIGDIINSINTVSKGAVIASLNSDLSGLQLVDNTSGKNIFTIAALNDSLAALDLGILGPSSTGIIKGKQINKPFGLDTNITEFNNGNGIRNNEAELEITLRDGSKFFVDFNTETTLAEIITTIEEASQDPENNSNRIAVSIDQNGQRLFLLDQTSGTGIFSIQALNNSLAGKDLGIIGSSVDGVIQGQTLDNDTFFNHIYIDPDSKIDITTKVTANNLNFSGSFASFKLGVNNGTADFNFTATSNIIDPTPNDLGISYSDISNTSLLVNPSYTGKGNITLPLEFKGLNQFGLETPRTDLIVNFIAENNKIIKTVKPFKFNSPISDLEEKIKSLQNFSLDDVSNLAEQVITFLDNKNLSLFNEKVPLVDQSINELLGFLNPIKERYNKYKESLDSLQNVLAEKTEKFENLIFEPSLLSQLPASVSQQLQNTLATLNKAIDNLPSGLDILKKGIQPELISAINQIQELIKSLPQQSINTIKDEIDNAINSLPFSDKLNTAKNNLFAVLDSADLNLESFNQAFDQLKIAGIDLLEHSVSEAIITLQPILVNLKTASVQEIYTIVETLNTTLDHLPAQIDKTKLLAAKNKITLAVDQVDYILLDQGIADLETAIVQLPGTDVAEFYEKIEAASGELIGNLANKAFNLLVKEIPAFGSIEEFLKNLIGFGDFHVSLGFNPDKTLVFNLDWDINASKQVPLNFSLNNPVRNFVSTEANLTVKTGANISLDFGLDLLNTTPNIYLLPTTELNLSAGFNSQINAKAGINDFIEAKLGGYVNLFNPNSSDPSDPAASFSINLKDVDQDGKIILNSNSADSIEVSNSLGVIKGEIPVLVTISGKETRIGTISISSESWTKGINIDPNLNFSQIKLTDFSDALLQAGIDKFLSVIKNTLENNILSKIPLIGDQISGKTQGFIDNLKTKINQAISTLSADFIGNEIVFNDLNLQGNFTFFTDFDLGLDFLNLLKFNSSGGVEVNLGYNLNFGIGLNKIQGFFFKLSPDKPEFDFDLTIGLTDDTKIKSKFLFLNATATNLNEAKAHIDYNGDGDFNDTTGFTGQLSIDIIAPSPTDGILTIQDLSKVNFTYELNPKKSSIETEQPPFDFNVLLGLELSLGTNDLPSLDANLIIKWDKLDSDNNQPLIKLTNIKLDLGNFLRDTVGSYVKNVDSYIEPVRPIIEFLQSEVPIVSQVSQLVGLGKTTVLDIIGLFADSDDFEDAKRLIEVVAGISKYTKILKEFLDNTNFYDFDDLIFNNQTGNFETGNLEAKTKSSLKNQVLPNIFSELGSELKITFPIFDKPMDNLIKLLSGKTNFEILKWGLPKLDINFPYRYRYGPIYPPYPIYATFGGRLGFLVDLSVVLDGSGIKSGNVLNGLYFNDLDENNNDIPELGLSVAFTAGAEVYLPSIPYLQRLELSIGIEGGIEANIFGNWNDPNHDGKVYYQEILKNARRNWLRVLDFEGELAAFLDSYAKIVLNLDFGKKVTLLDKTITLAKVSLYKFKLAGDENSSPSPSEQPETNPTLGHYSTGEGEDAGIEKGSLIVHVGRFANLRQPGVSVDTAEQVYITRLKSGALEVHTGFRSDYRQQSSDPHTTGSVQVFGDDPNEAIPTKIYIDLAEGDDLIEIDQLVTAETIILGGNGDDTILIRTTTDPLSGKTLNHYVEGGAGNDRITSSIGNDTIIGGVSSINPIAADGNDIIVGGGGNDLIFGDNGRILQNGQTVIILQTGEAINTRLETIATSDGGNDVIFVGGGNDTVMGGIGNDHISGADNNAGEDIIFGDNGQIDYLGQNLQEIKSIDAINSGNDRIYAKLGNDIVIGGGGDDYIEAGKKDESIEGIDGEDIIFGDHGRIEFDDHGPIKYGQKQITHLISTDFDHGGNDTIDVGFNKDFAAGGGGNDQILNQGDDDEIFFGDQGEVKADLIVSLSATTDGDDLIQGAGGNDSLLAGGGNDNVEGVEGEDIIFGDHGRIESVNNIVTRLISTDFANGGNDQIAAGTEKDIVFGGAKNDIITNNDDNSPDIIYGDQGYWEANLISNVSDKNDGNDRIFSEGGDDIILAGGAKDYVESGNNLDIIFGDHGIVTRQNNVIIRIETSESKSGDNDTLLAGNDDDTVLGGPQQ